CPKCDLHHVSTHGTIAGTATRCGPSNAAMGRPCSASRFHHRRHCELNCPTPLAQWPDHGYLSGTLFQEVHVMRELSPDSLVSLPTLSVDSGLALWQALRATARAEKKLPKAL